MTELEWLADVVRRVPVMHVDVDAAEAAEDAPRLAYARAMARWTDEAAIAVSEALAAASEAERGRRVESDEGNPSRPPSEASLQLVRSDRVG
ncbi:hypothetical protein [Methylobacterium sp. WL6]|uniref:hypothetical protein n=1 Tax=Methylobacterium sp. WL6 TaxID=2603901 RepID=UPI0011CCCD3F|nr:hypothetical protein [Methylobacterium sp. WL6]TXN71734.1 hypothetical protein FV230_07375 [Methylobacterium sp. WL6]